MMYRFRSSLAPLALALSVAAAPASQARECADEDLLERVRSVEIELLEEIDVSKCGDKASVAFHENGVASCGSDAKRDVLERSAHLRVPKPSGGTISKSRCRLSPDAPHYGFYPSLVAKQIRFGSVASDKCPGSPTVVDYRALEPAAPADKRAAREGKEDSFVASTPSTYGAFRKSFGKSAKLSATCDGEKPSVLGKDTESSKSGREPASSKRSRK
jgi:hypothetical protein